MAGVHGVMKSFTIPITHNFNGFKLTEKLLFWIVAIKGLERKFQRRGKI